MAQLTLKEEDDPAHELFKKFSLTGCRKGSQRDSTCEKGSARERVSADEIEMS